MERVEERNWYWKREKEGSFMRMKEDGMGKGERKGS